MSEPVQAEVDVADTQASSPVGERVPAGGRERRRARGWALRHRWEVARHLVARELATRHRGSLLGWFWSLVPPLLQLGAAYLVFTRVIPLGIDDYPVFLLVGLLTWNWLARSVTSATDSLESGRDLVLRPGFDSMLLPLAQVLVNLVDYFLALPVLVAAIAVTTGLSAKVLLLPVLLLIQFILIFGIALLVAPVQVFLRDVRHAVALAVMVGFWVTPIFYEARNVPGAFSLVYDLNPMAHLIEAHRDIFLHGAFPDWSAVAGVAAGSLTILVAGAAVFSALRHSVPDRL